MRKKPPGPFALFFTTIGADYRISAPVYPWAFTLVI